MEEEEDDLYGSAPGQNGNGEVKQEDPNGGDYDMDPEIGGVVEYEDAEEEDEEDDSGSVRGMITACMHSIDC